jgi:hypothetical protein
MRASATILALLLVASSAAAQDEPRPDYSRDTLMRLFVAASPEEAQRNYRDVGMTVAAFGTTFQIHALPQLMMPLSGSVMRTSKEWPDPFSLTRTQIATSHRAWHTRRNVNRELRRINMSERARLRVTRH